MLSKETKDSKVIDAPTEVVVTGKPLEHKSKDEVKAEKTQQKVAEDAKAALDKIHSDIDKEHEKKAKKHKEEREKHIKDGKVVDIKQLDLGALRQALKEDEAKSFVMSGTGRARLEEKLGIKSGHTKAEKWEYWAKIRDHLGLPDVDPDNRAMVYVTLNDVVIINGEKFGPGEDTMVPASAYSTWKHAHVEPEEVSAEANRTI